MTEGNPAAAVTGIETKILNAGNRALEIEKTLFQSLKQAVLTHPLSLDHQIVQTVFSFKFN